MTVNIVTGEDDLDPREIVMEGRSGEYPPMVEWGDQLPIPPQDPMIGIEDEVRLATQQFATEELQDTEQSLEEIPQVPPTGALALPPADESMFNMFTGPQDLNRMVQEQPQNNPQWFPAQQQAAETGIPIFNRENPLFVQQPNLQAQYGASGADLARRSRFRSQRFQRTYQQAQAPQPLNTTPNTDPAVPQSTRSIFQGQYGGASVGTPPPAWNIGRELSQTWDLIRGFITDVVTPEDGRLDSLQDLWSIALNAAPITSRPVRGLVDQLSGNPDGLVRANPNTARALIPFAQSMAPAAQQDTAQPWYFNPGQGYFGEMGTGLRGAALYTIAMPGQLAAASVYSIVDLGRYLAGGQDNLPGNPNDYRSQGLRFMQAFTGQDLGFTNVRDANGNRYLAAIDPNAPLPLQFAQGAIGFIGDAVGLGWVDDALGMAASRAARALPQRVPTPPVTPTLPPSAPVRPQATVDPETEFPMPGRPEAYEPLIVAEFTPFSQYTVSLDPDLAIPERVFRNNQEITQLAENSGVIPPGTGTLTNAEVNELENLYPYGEFRRYGIRGVITGGMDEATNTLEERTARMNQRLDEMIPPTPELRVYTGWEQRTRRRANLTVIEAIRPPRIGVVRTPPGNQAEVIDFQARLDAMRQNLPADMANGSDVAVAGAADAGEGIVSMGRAQAQLSTEMVELHEQLRAHLDELSALPVIGRNYIGDEQAMANLYDTSLRNANQPRFGQGNPNTLLSESMGISTLADSFNNAIPLAKVRELPGVAKLPTTMQDELLSALVTRGELGLEGEGDKLTISVLRRDPGYQQSTGVVLYHGSKQLDIENISPNQGGASNELGAGLYLTSNPREAEQYAKAGRTRTQSVTASTNRDTIGRVYEVATYNKKPLDVTQTVKPDTPINKMFKDVVRSLYGDRFARTYGTAIAGKPISEYWLAVRDVWGIANPQRPISEMKYQEFQRQISRGLQEQGYDSLVQPSRGITVVLDPETGRLPIRVQSEKPVGIGTPLEALRAQRMIDQNLHNFYKRPSTEVMALQSRVALETQALDTLVQAYEDSLRRGEDAAEFFLRAEQTLKDSSRMIRDANVVDAIEESTAAADEAVAKVDIGDDSPCL